MRSGLLIWLWVWLVAPFLTGAAEPVVVGYLPDYRLSGFEGRGMEQVTDLVYFSLEPSGDGAFEPADLPGETVRRLRELKAEMKCRLLISVGGWGRSDGFASMCADPVARKRFVQGVVGLCRRHGFDGVDYDWEHPKTEAQHQDYRTLLGETKSAGETLLVTVAQASWQDLGKEAYRVVDRVHLMSYDHDYPQATLGKARRDVKQLLGWGCPAGKIALGLPFYGRNARREARGYVDLVGGKMVKPDLDVIDGFAFNGRRTIRAKADWARQRQLAGVMIWELGQDDRRKGVSLLEVVGGGMRGVQSHRDLVYARVGNRELKLDLYVPKDAVKPVPVIIWIHGGAWRAGGRSNGGRARQMVARGYAVADVEYRLSQEAIFPAAIVDCKGAVRWLRANAKRYGLDPKRFGAWGASAGGHLAALLGTAGDVEDWDEHKDHLDESPRVQAVCDWFGPTDFLRMNDFKGRMDHNAPGSPESQFIGGPIQENREKVGRANPMTYVTKDDPPFLIVHGDNDLLVPFNQSELLDEVLKKKGVKVRLYKVEGGGHGFGGARRDTQRGLFEMSARFFDEAFGMERR